MDITIQLASRGRSKLLHNLIENIQNTATNPDTIEIIIYIDEDDNETQDAVKGLKVIPFIGPRGRGYSDAARWHNTLYKLSSGKVIMQANDDMYFLTEGWDDVFRQHFNDYSDGIYLLHPWNQLNPWGTPFPIVGRRVPEIMGKFIPDHITYIDCFYYTVLDKLNRHINIPEVKLAHCRLHDETTKENRAALSEWKNQGHVWDKHKGGGVYKPDVDLWVKTLKEHMNE